MHGFIGRATATLLLALVSMAGAMAQQTVSGTIKDEAGEPLPGVSVTLKGTQTGTVSEINGNFKLTVRGPEDILVFSFIGMIRQEQAVGNRSSFDIVMVENAIQMNEVVVVGYGTQKRVNLSGAVDQLDPAMLQDRPISSVAQGLQGTVPNLNIDFASGTPGQAANINIRGITSINGGNPLILIDGIPSEPIELNRLSPQDIESISVLKDAASAAIYGARAAFGIIMINTKTGRKEGMQFEYSNNFSWDRPTVLPQKITDPYIYTRLQENSHNNTPWNIGSPNDATYQWARERSDNPSLPGVRVNPNDPSTWEYMGGRDWTSYFMNDFTTSQNHQLALSGASEKTSYFVSGNYNRQNGVMSITDDYFDRYGFRSRVDFRPFKWLSVGNNSFLSSTKRERPSDLNIFTIYNLSPTSWDINPDGSWANSGVGRMAAQLTGGGRDQSVYNSLQSRFTTEMSFLKNTLKVNGDFTYRRGVTDRGFDRKKYQIGFGPEDIRELGNNYAYKSADYERYNALNLYTTYSNTFGNHHVTAIAGYNQEEFRNGFFSAERNNVISASLPSIALATGDAFVNESVREWAIRGAFYRLNYIFKDRYIIEFNGRYDGSSRFPSRNRFGFFPSASAAWRMDEEAFMIPLEDVVNSLKLRASYGALGNQSVSEYGYIPSMNASLANVIIGGERPQRVTPPQLVSDNYSWETVSTVNFGLDAGFFQDRIQVVFDVYSRDTKGMLTQGKDLPDVLGAPEPNENAADLRTKGWELSVSYQNHFMLGNKPLGFNSRFILSDSRSFITRFDNPSNNLLQYYEGMELGEIWGLRSDGFFRSQEEIDRLNQSAIIPWGALAIVPGWPRFQDLNGDGAITKGFTTDEPGDLSVIGNKLPRFRYGLSLGADWNGFDLNVFFQGVGRRDYYPQDYLYWGFYQQPYVAGHPHTLDHFRANDDPATLMAQHSQAYINAGLANANPDARFPVFQAWLADRNLGERIDRAQGLAIPQTSYLLSGAYLRLKNITVGYNLPERVLRKLNIERLRVFVSGENVAEWSPISAFYDPEAINDNLNLNPAVGNSRGTGSGYTYPFQRRFALGMNLTF